jgi:hypothetical protein
VACDNGGVDDISTLLMKRSQVHENDFVLTLWATSSLLILGRDADIVAEVRSGLIAHYSM